eukprot:503558_1
MTQSTEIRALQKLWVNLLRDIIKLNETSVMNNMHPKESGIIFDRKVDLSMAFLINLVYEMKKCSEQMAQVTGQHNKDDDITHTNINDNNNDTDTHIKEMERIIYELGKEIQILKEEKQIQYKEKKQFIDDVLRKEKQKYPSYPVRRLFIEVSDTTDMNFLSIQKLLGYIRVHMPDSC